MDIVKSFEDILEILQKYFVYLYPGFISLLLYRFLKGEDFIENWVSVVKCIIISFVLIHIKMFLESIPFMTYVPELIFYMALACFSSFAFWKIMKNGKIKSLLSKLGISTNIIDNPFDIAREKEKSLWISAYMDDLGIMYEGSLRNYVSDLTKAKYIMISDYRIYKIDKGKESNVVTYTQTYPQKDQERMGKSNDWVILHLDKITRVEILFDKPQ